MAKLEEMMKNEEFVKKMAQMDSDVEIAKLFKANNVEMTVEEFEKLMDDLNIYMAKSESEEINENDLDAVVGGGIVAGAAVYLIGSIIVAVGGKHTIKRIKNEASCVFKGESAYPDSKFYVCK